MSKGVAAACLNSLHSSAERKSVLAQIEQGGELLLLFVTPEMLQNRKVHRRHSANPDLCRRHD